MTAKIDESAVGDAIVQDTSLATLTNKDIRRIERCALDDAGTTFPKEHQHFFRPK